MRDQLRRFLPIPLLAVACLYTYKLEVPETHTYAAAGINRVTVTTENGAVSVAESTATVIRVDVLKYAYGRNREDAEKAIANVVYSDTIVGGELKAKVEMPSGNRPYGASFTVSAPDTTNL